jgi:hypothetical protein
MNSQLEDFLRKLADEVGTNGERNFGQPLGQAIESFQADVDRLYMYEAEGMLDTSIPHEENRSGNKYIDSIRVKLTKDGEEKWRSKP